MTSKTRRNVENLSRFLVYILGHRPDEFGVLPDEEGFVTLKDLLHAVHEERGWGYVSKGSINEVLLGKDRDRFDCRENRLRTLTRRWRLEPVDAAVPMPKLLYLGIRAKAHPHALEKGLKAPSRGGLLLSPDREMALRIGKRRDREPVILEVLTERARQRGVRFHALGELYAALELPPECIMGPPLPRETVKSQGKETTAKKQAPPAPQPGAFLLEDQRDPAPYRRARRDKRKGWKEEARKERRRKGH